MGASSTILMVVPMFHANSWGLNFSGTMPHSMFLCVRRDS
jgi:nicotinic acid phosphoribosyltransferase